MRLTNWCDSFLGLDHFVLQGPDSSKEISISAYIELDFRPACCFTRTDRLKWAWNWVQALSCIHADGSISLVLDRSLSNLIWWSSTSAISTSAAPNSHEFILCSSANGLSAGRWKVNSSPWCGFPLLLVPRKDFCSDWRFRLSQVPYSASTNPLLWIRIGKSAFVHGRWRIRHNEAEPARILGTYERGRHLYIRTPPANKTKWPKNCTGDFLWMGQHMKLLSTPSRRLLAPAARETWSTSDHNAGGWWIGILTEMWHVLHWKRGSWLGDMTAETFVHIAREILGGPGPESWQRSK